MHVDWEVLFSGLSTLIGGSLAVGVAKHFLGNSLNHLQALPLNLAEIKGQLNKMQDKLETIDKIQITLHEHDRKILSLELKGGKGRVSNRRAEPNCQA